MGMTTHLSH